MRKATVGMITIGQAPRVDVVPEMADLMGPGVQIVERGALDGLAPAEIAALAPAGDDEVLVTRLLTGDSVFVGKRHVTPRVQQKIDDLTTAGVDVIVVLCTGQFPGLRATRPLVEPEKVLRGVLAGVTVPGRLGVITPSVRHVPQTRARWQSHGHDAVVVALSPYDGARADAREKAHDAGALGAVAATLRAGGVGLVLLDCMGFRREAREALRAALGVPVIVANLLVARVVAEMVGA